MFLYIPKRFQDFSFLNTTSLLLIDVFCCLPWMKQFAPWNGWFRPSSPPIFGCFHKIQINLPTDFLWISPPWVYLPQHKRKQKENQRKITQISLKTHNFGFTKSPKIFVDISKLKIPFFQIISNKKNTAWTSRGHLRKLPNQTVSLFSWRILLDLPLNTFNCLFSFPKKIELASFLLIPDLCQICLAAKSPITSACFLSQLFRTFFWIRPRDLPIHLMAQLFCTQILFPSNVGHAESKTWTPIPRENFSDHCK